MFPTIQIGPLNLQAPPFILLIAFWLGLSLAEHFAPRRGISADNLYNLVFTALISGIIGARLGYLTQFPTAYSSIRDVISVNLGLFDPWSGLAVGFIAALIYGQRKKLPLLPTLDSLTPVFAVTMVGISLSQLAAGTAFGMETTLPWGVELWGATRHPTQIYAIIASLSTLILLSPKILPTPRSGILLARFISATSAWNVFILAFRGDSTLTFSGLRIEQIIAWLALLTSLIILNHLHNQSAKNG